MQKEARFMSSEDLEAFSATLKTKVFSFSDLTEKEKEELEAQRKARAKKEGRDLLDGVICVKQGTKDE